MTPYDSREGRNATNSTAHFFTLKEALYGPLRLWKSRSGDDIMHSNDAKRRIGALNRWYIFLERRYGSDSEIWLFLNDISHTKPR